MKHILKLTLIICFVLSGCSSDKCNEAKELVERINDSIVVNKIVNECENNQILFEQEYKKITKDSLIPHGIYREFYRNGRLKISGGFENGFKNGRFLYYFPSGKVEAEDFVENGELYGPQKQYYSNGMLKSIIYHKSNLVSWFKVDLDSNGIISHWEGRPIRKIAKPDFYHPKKGDDAIAVIEVPIIERYKTVLNFEISKNSSKLHDTTISKFTHRSSGNYDYFPLIRKFEESGMYIFSFEVCIFDSVSNTIKLSDKTSDTIYVKN